MINRHSKFSYADTLSLVVALIYGYFCFLGANFMFIQDDKVWGLPRILGCLAIAVFCAGALFFTAWGAKTLRGTKKNHKELFIWEISLLVLFAMFSLYFTTQTSPFMHYWTVSSKSGEITEKVLNAIDQTENMFSKYESLVDNRMHMYKGRLTAVVRSETSTDDPITDEEKVKTRIEIMKMDLLPPRYSDPVAQNGIKEVALVWLGNARDATQKWKAMGVVSSVIEIDKNSKEWESILSSLYVEGKQKQPEELLDPPVFQHEVKFNRLSVLFSQTGFPGFGYLLFSIFLCFLMLLSWFITPRDGGKGYSKLKPYEVEL